MTYYRGDFRDGLRAAEPSGLYEDGGGRPKNCKKEVAFADSVGGAVYGAAQYLTHDARRDMKNFGNDETAFKVHVYETDRKPDYEPSPTSLNRMLNVETDFDVTGEVRFCEKVPVRKACTCSVTKHEMEVMKTLLYNEYHGEDFRYYDNQNPLAWEKMLPKIVRGDKKALKKALANRTPQEKLKYINTVEKERQEYHGDPAGIDTYVAGILKDLFERRCR